MMIFKNKDKANFIIAMAIFGTIGIFRRYIPLPSSLVALVRGIIGTVFLLAVLSLQKRKMDWATIQKCFPILLISGAAIGFNWILLFEAYSYTSVATATLCYYLAPIIVILAAPLVLKDKLTLRHGICAAAALLGMIPVSGILETGITGLSEMKGIFCGLGAAVLYASVILMNKKMPAINAYDKTILQLLFASAALLPYVAFTTNLAQLSLTPVAIVMLLTVGILHTGIAYWMYFGSIQKLSAHTVALWSYLDPVLAIILSTVLLKEPLSLPAWIGAAIILCAAYICEK